MKTHLKFRRSLFALLSSTALIIPSAAFAQDASATDEASDDDAIVVTAQRREERLQDVPISITALGAQKLEQANVQSFDDYAKLLPSVSFQSFGPSQAQIFFRGVSSGGDGLHIGPLPTSSMYIDEIPVTTIGGTVDFHVYDVARVEALAGPQGTLFGASSLSGVLRLITNAPKLGETSGSVDLQLSKYGKGDFGGSAEGYVNFPLGDSAALRVVGFYDRQGGYIDNLPNTRTFTLDDPDPTTNVTVNNSALVKNDYNDVETYGGRAALKIDLDDNWTATTQFIYQNQVANGGFLFDPTKGDLAVTDFLPSRNHDRWWQAALTIQGKLSDWDVTYSGGYFERKVDSTSDYSYYSVAYDTYGSYATYFPDGKGGFLDPTQSVVLGDKYTKLTQELRVSSPSDMPFRLTAGLFMQHQTDTVRADYKVAGITAAPLPSWFPGVFDNDTVFRSRIFRKDRDYAMFAQAEYDLAPTLTAIAGIRGYIADNTLYGFSGFNGGSSVRACIAGTTYPESPCVSIDKKQVESGVIWRGGLRFKPSDNLMLYATVSRGFRPGGNNRRPGVDPFKSDKLDNYEVGWKTHFGNVYFNGAAFYEKWKNVQFGLVPLNNNGITNTYNAGNARIYGIEGDISTRIGGLSLSASGTYVDAKTTTDLCAVDPVTKNIVCDPLVPPVAPAGTRLPVMPKFKGSVTARYEAPMANGKGFIQTVVSHQGGTRSALLDSEAIALGFTKAFTSVDFSAGVHWDKWRVEAFIQNAFDTRGELGRGTFCATGFCAPYARTYPTRPQLFGVKVGVDF
ncbi:TonB-dependent receptor [Novosphingobium sp.]|uniref:TonB-dependent receptor n=1 Tax=Novosphingobium sp. TaxID=1874826 RepID=UPI0025CEAE50|nr:TonB-dependent receptor [Novosphingobium sp.]